MNGKIGMRWFIAWLLLVGFLLLAAFVTAGEPTCITLSDSPFPSMSTRVGGLIGS